MNRSSLFFKTGVAALNQGMLSAINFLISILLIKSVAKEEFGYYSIAFAVSLFLVSLQNAVITTPMAVLLATKSPENQKRYVAALNNGQALAVIPAVCISLAITAILYFLGWDLTKAAISGALALAAIGILFREFLRAYFFAAETPLKVLILDSFYLAAYSGFVVMAYFFLRLTVAGVFLFMGVSAFMVAVIYHRGDKQKFNWHSIQESYREHWPMSKWALLGVIVTHVQSYCYLYLLGALLDSAAVAEASASRLLLMPLVFLQSGWSKVAMPHGARLRQQNQIKRFFKEQVVASVVIGAIIIVYVGILLAGADFLKQALLTEKYKNSFAFLMLWGISFAMSFITLNASFGLQVLKDFHVITRANIITMLVTLGLAYFLITSYGIAGGLLALITGDALLAMTLWYFFGKKVFSRPEINLQVNFVKA